MFFQITIKKNNPYLDELKKQRFHLSHQDMEWCFFTKRANKDILYLSFIDDNCNLITYEEQPKLFNKYYKLALRNKCPLKMEFILSEKMKSTIVNLNKNKNPIFFTYSEDLFNLSNKKITNQQLQSNIYVIEHGVNYFLE